MIVQRVGIPIYLQVKDFILDKIKSGEYQSGTKIPTERELSITLGISRNTVIAAYKELLLEGVLEAWQGRGTFVKSASDDEGGTEVASSRRGRLMKIIDDECPDSEKLDALKAAFYAVNKINQADADQDGVGTIDEITVSQVT